MAIHPVKSGLDPCGTPNTDGSGVRKGGVRGAESNTGVVFGRGAHGGMSMDARIHLRINKHAGGPWGPPSLAYIQKGIVLNYHKLIKVTTKRFNEMRGKLAGGWGWIQVSALPVAWRGDGKATALGERSETQTLGVPRAPIRRQRISGS